MSAFDDDARQIAMAEERKRLDYTQFRRDTAPVAASNATDRIWHQDTVRSQEQSNQDDVERRIADERRIQELRTQDDAERRIASQMVTQEQSNQDDAARRIADERRIQELRNQDDAERRIAGQLRARGAAAR